MAWSAMPCSPQAFATLLHDPFANYVIQTLLTVGDDSASATHLRVLSFPLRALSFFFSGEDDVVSLLVAKITPHLPTLRSTLYGKRIQAKLLKRCPATKAALPQR